MNDSKIHHVFIQNLFLIAGCIAVALVALLAKGIDSQYRAAIATGTLAYAAGLWRHSGRDRTKLKPPGLPLPPACLAFLVFSCLPGCTTRLHVGIEEEAHVEGINADYLRMAERASLPSECIGYGCAYTKSSDHLPRFADTSGNEYIAGTSWRARQYAGTPGGVVIGDVWHDTTTGYLMWRSPSGNVVIGTAAGLPLTSPVLTTPTIGGAPTVATFYRVCTITSAAAATPINCLSAADVPASLSAKLGSWRAKVNGATAWSTTTTCTIEDTAGNDLIVIAVGAMTGNAFLNDSSANVTKESRYALGTGGANDVGLQVVCDANGAGSDLVVTLMGTIQ